MNKTLAFLTVLALAGAAFGDVAYDDVTKTLTYGAPTDLDSVVDPATPPPLADVQQSFGIQLADWNLLSPQVIAFNTAASGGPPPGVSLPVMTLVANYKPGQTVTFDHFGPLRDAQGNHTGYQAYNWGGYTSGNRTAFSGSQPYHDFGLIQSDPPGNPKPTVNYRYLSADVTVSEPLTGVAGFGLCLHGRTETDSPTGPGEILFTLDSGTQARVVLPAWGGTNALQRLFVGYQAPSGRFITRIEGIRYGGGSCFPASDDWSFLIKTYLPGDADLNRKVEFADYQILEQHFGATTGAAWGDGDFDGDGQVTFADYQILEQNFGNSIPEPVALSLLALGGLGLIRRRRA